MLKNGTLLKPNLKADYLLHCIMFKFIVSVHETMRTTTEKFIHQDIFSLINFVKVLHISFS